MSDHKGMEREISMSELIWSILFGWRKFLCLAAVFAILAGALRFALDMKNYRAAGVSGAVEESQLTEKEREEIKNVRTLRDEVVKYREYLDTSVLMQIDPYNEPMMELQYKIESDYVMNYTKDILHDDTPDVISMYNRYLASGEMRRALIEGAKLEIDPKDLEELVGVNRDSNMLYVVVGYPDAEKLDAIIDTLKELLGKKEGEIQKVGSHKLVFVGEDKYSMVNDALIEKKSTILTRIAAVNVQINQLKTALTEEQKKILDEEEGEVERKPPVFRKKYVVVGAFLGLLFAGIWIVCGVLFTEKLQAPEEIRSLYGECLFGEVRAERKKKRFLSVVDHKLSAMKNRRKKKLSQEQQINMACINAAVICKRKGIKNIFVTGSEYENIDASFKKLLKQKLMEQGLQVKEGENMCYNAHSLKQGEEIGNILLVEQTEKSLYDEIFKEIRLAKDQSMELLGVIVVTQELS